MFSEHELVFLEHKLVFSGHNVVFLEHKLVFFGHRACVAVRGSRTGSCA